MGRGLALALAGGLLAAASASADPSFGGGPIEGGPALAGDSVLFSSVPPGSRSLQLLRQPIAGGAPVQLTTAIPPSSSSSSSTTLELDASASLYVVREASYTFSPKIPGDLARASERLRAGAVAGGPLAELASCLQGSLSAYDFAVSGSQVAYAFDDCTTGAAKVIVRGVGGGVVAVIPRPLATNRIDVALAGRFLAVSERGGQIDVYDLSSGAVVYTVRSGENGLPQQAAAAFAVQEDGKLVGSFTAPQGSPCRSSFSWFSVAEPLPHTVPGVCGTDADARFAFVGDRIAWMQFRQSGRGTITVANLAGATVFQTSGAGANIGQAVEGDVDFDGERVAYTVEGCEPAGDRVYVDAVADGADTANTTQCSATIARKTLRPRNRRVLVAVRCSQGCTDGRLVLRQGRRTVGRARFDVVRAGQTVRMSAKLSRRFANTLLARGRARLTAKLEFTGRSERIKVSRKLTVKRP